MYKLKVEKVGARIEGGGHKLKGGGRGNGFMDGTVWAKIRVMGS